MAIGSAPEIGTDFGTLEGWLDNRVTQWREEVGPDLMGGYATVLWTCKWVRDRIDAEALDGPYVEA